MEKVKQINNAYRQAAIVLSVCSIVYLALLYFKGMSIAHGRTSYMIITALCITVVPYFISKGQRVVTLVFAWFFLFRSAMSVWSLSVGTSPVVTKYAFPTLVLVTIVLFRAAYSKKD